MKSPAVPTFYVFVDSVGAWRFLFCCDLEQSRLKGIAGYRAKANVLEAIEAVRRNVPYDERYSFEENSRGKHFCTLRSESGEVLAMSRNHTDYETLIEDLRIIQAEVPIAVVEETGSRNPEADR